MLVTRGHAGAIEAQNSLTFISAIELAAIWCAQLGINKFADMTEEEFRAAYLGYRSARNPMLS